ncbi:MAG: primosomal protein N' [Spirochaetes bacterium]|jgi:primosomal protein N' (replication factor Y)|nr:primosomal protein N' [Spirochaetota bacterium]
MKYADVFLSVPQDSFFTYSIPENMHVTKGVRVVVPFGKRTLPGAVITTHNKKPMGFAVKPILEFLDDQPLFSDTFVELCDYTATTYCAARGEVYALALPGRGSGVSRYKDPFIVEPYSFKLSDKQQSVCDEILKSATQAHLLFGVTGSGKTELYMELALRQIAAGKSVIYLVPEITLSSQLHQRLLAVFGDDLVLYHSGLTPNQRAHHWKLFYTNKKKIVVGTRSAIFMQAEKLGLIIIDEEHDSSYKENSTPRYSAKRLALYRMKREGCTVVLGSATPSIESYFAAKTGVLHYHELNERFGNAGVPQITTVDVGDSKEGISNLLRVETTEAARRGEQSVYLLNRRGYSPVLLCGDCKKRVECPDCCVSLNYHSDGFLRCHYCGYSVVSFTRCPSCNSENLKKIGSGTQRVEEHIETLFPSLRVYRLDRDSSKKKGAIVDLIERINQREVDVIVGTQMIAKGFDFHHITVVGILMADIGMNLPDFRSTERIFSLLMQVAGRCGRGELPGKVIVQTLDPQHYLFEFVRKQDYSAFYEHEIKLRKMMNYPPFVRLIRVVMRGKNEGAVLKVSDDIGDYLKSAVSAVKGVQVLGPAPAPFTRLGGNFRYHIIVKIKAGVCIREHLLQLVKKFKKPDLYLEIDIDPVDLL